MGQITGMIDDDPACGSEVDAWIEAARVAREFVNRWNAHGPAHHCAAGVGHLAGHTANLGALLGMPATRPC